MLGLLLGTTMTCICLGSVAALTRAPVGWPCLLYAVGGWAFLGALVSLFWG